MTDIAQEPSTDETQGPAHVSFTAPSGRVYQHQADFGGDLLVPVVLPDGSAAWEKIPGEDMEALIAESMRVFIARAVTTLDDDDTYEAYALLRGAGLL